MHDVKFSPALPSCQLRGSLRMEQGSDLHPQRAESAALAGALRRGGHQEHQERRVHVQDHLCQGQAAHTHTLTIDYQCRILTADVLSSPQSRYWSSDNSKNEVQGVVLNRAGEVVHRFGGLWHEGIFCDTLPTPKCIWKPSECPVPSRGLFNPFILLTT